MKYEYHTQWLSPYSKFRVELDEGTGYEILVDNLIAYEYFFTTEVISVIIKVTPYIDNVLTPEEAKITEYTTLDIPANLTLDSDINDEIIVSWDIVTNAELYRVVLRYIVIEKISKSTSELTTIFTLNDITNYNGGWPFFDIYVYAIKGVNESLPAKLTINAIVPSKPTNFIVQKPQNSGLLLSWDKVDTAIGYVIYQGTTIKFDPKTEGTLVYSGVNHWAIIDQLDMSVDYEFFFKVAAYDIYYKNRTDLLFSNTLVVTPVDGDTIYCKSFDDANLSGAPLILRLQNTFGDYFYTKVYPIISASINGTSDNIGENLLGLSDADLSGTPKIAKFKSGGVFYYFKIYPTISAEIEDSAGVTLTPICSVDNVLLTPPRVARIQLDSIYYYFKIYSTVI